MPSGNFLKSTHISFSVSHHWVPYLSGLFRECLLDLRNFRRPRGCCSRWPAPFPDVYYGWCTVLLAKPANSAEIFSAIQSSNSLPRIPDKFSEPRLLSKCTSTFSALKGIAIVNWTSQKTQIQFSLIMMHLIYQHCSGPPLFSFTPACPPLVCCYLVSTIDLFAVSLFFDFQPLTSSLRRKPPTFLPDSVHCVKRFFRGALHIQLFWNWFSFGFVGTLVGIMALDASWIVWSKPYHGLRDLSLLRLVYHQTFCQYWQRTIPILNSINGDMCKPQVKQEDKITTLILSISAL